VKKMILNVLVFVSLLMILTTAILNTSFANRLEEDPNEPGAESVFTNCLGEDVNEPQAEIAFMNACVSCSDRDVNEPQAENI